jgi:hypothetical protein
MFPERSLFCLVIPAFRQINSLDMEHPIGIIAGRQKGTGTMIDLVQKSKRKHPTKIAIMQV